MSQYTRKKNIINIGGLCCPLPYHPRPLQQNRNNLRHRPSIVSLPPISFTPPYPTPIVSAHRIHTTFYLSTTIIRSFSYLHCTIICHCVMSSCHTHIHIQLTNLIRYHLDNIYVTTKQYNSTLSNI